MPESPAPLNKLELTAAGLLVVIVDASFNGYDAIPDPLGWMLVLLGLLPLRHALPGARALTALAVLAGALASVLYWPPASDRTGLLLGWVLSLPEVLFSVLLCGALASLVRVSAPRIAARLSVLRWVFAVLAVAPVPVLAAQDHLPQALSVVTVLLALVAVLANLYLVYLVLRVSRLHRVAA